MRCGREMSYQPPGAIRIRRMQSSVSPSSLDEGLLLPGVCPTER